jgi:hypothetical protein
LGVRRCHLSLYHFQANERRIDGVGLQAGRGDGLGELRVREHDLVTETQPSRLHLQARRHDAGSAWNISRELKPGITIRGCRRS